jgi:flagellar hook-associated protein 1 FlgK
MGLAALDSALSGLRIAQQQISVISNNVANVGTPGFTRKILPQSSQSIQGVTVGVISETIIRRVDLNLERDLWTQISTVGQLDIQKSYLSRIEQFHGPPDKELSIAAELSRLKDSFSALSDNPSDTFLLSAVVDKAVDAANKINNLSGLITTLRNDTQTDITATVDRINDLLTQIAELNGQIQGSSNVNRSSALLEDKRDDAIKELAGLIDITFFKRGDGVLVVQTNGGIELASTRSVQLSFSPTAQSPLTYYPASSSSVLITDLLVPNAQPLDITAASPGGKLGGLLELRDTIFPQQMAQLDELSHKLALRFEAQGLRLFTDGSGNLPADTPPDPTTLPNPTPVSYIGFSSRIRVNTAILNDNSLVQQGTTGAVVQNGSNEVIARVVEYAFGSVDFQQILNTNPATSVDLLNRGGDDLQTWLGLFSSNTLSAGRDLSAFATVADLVLSANGALDDPNDQFQITFEEARTGLGPTTITVDLSVADGFAGATAIDRLVAHINNEIALAGVPAGLAAVASVGANGELVMNTRGSIEIDSNFGATGIGQAGLDFLGLVDNAGNPRMPTDPYFDIQVGNDDPVRITLEPGDTDVDLIAKLQAVDGLAVDTVNFALDGFLRLRPGNDYDNPDFGGGLRITGGPFATSGASLAGPPALAGRTAIDDGVNIISALFGTYTDIDPGVGVIIQNDSPVSDVGYQSQTDGSLVPPIPTLPFRTDLLGPGADISTRINGASSLVDFAQKMVNQQTQGLNLTKARIADEDTLRQSLERQLLDDSGVNLDEELGHLITVQTAYAASARVITAVDRAFQDLLDIL